MRLSSTFNFDTVRGWRWWMPPWVVFLLILCLAAEILLRQPAVTARLPRYEATLWHMPIIQAKMDYLRQYAGGTGIDVLFIGNSTAQAGISPQVFDRVRGQSGMGSFNAAIEGLPPHSMELFLTIYLRYTRPRTIIYGLSPQDLNGNSPWARDVMERVNESPLALAEARQGWRGRVYAFWLGHSALFRYRFVLHQMLLRGGQFTALPDVYFDSRGYHPIERRLSEFPAQERGIFQNRAGVLNYSPQGEQVEALLRLIALSQAEGIELILVNMPLADDYYTNFDSEQDYASYLATVSRIAAEHQILFWDMERPAAAGGYDDTYFADFNHLNLAGAEALSRELAERYLQSHVVEAGETADPVP